jgi:hypothetical protein
MLQQRKMAEVLPTPMLRDTCAIVHCNSSNQLAFFKSPWLTLDPEKIEFRQTANGAASERISRDFADLSASECSCQSVTGLSNQRISCTSWRVVTIQGHAMTAISAAWIDKL